MADSLSVLDIAWLIYAHRPSLAGYPARLHPRLATWMEKLRAGPQFGVRSEVVQSHEWIPHGRGKDTPIG